jgi:phage gp45-like
MSGALARLRLMVQYVTDLAFDADGNVSGKGMDDEEFDAAVGYHFGFYSRPKDNAHGVIIKADGQGNTSFLFCFRDKQYELSLQKGEVGAQNAFSAYWLLNQNGVLELNGTTYAAPQWDPFSTALKAATTAILVNPAATDLATALTLLNGMRAAWSTFDSAMGTNNNYKSSKVKNG